ncbi:MAG: InlB B-repeat-containing protein [Alistipes sp.]|jgi:uncharacterized protein (TIGR02145 family)|nr:InlB B-repeat-containing protein [Alistipes sp.]
MKTLQKWVLICTAFAAAGLTGSCKPDDDNNGGEEPAATMYDIKFEANENGTAKAFVGDQEVTRAEEGDQVRIVATPADATGYTFGSWSIFPTTVALAAKESPETTFTMPAGDVTLVTTYNQVVTYNKITFADAFEHGTIEVRFDGEVIESGADIPAAGRVDLKAVPERGYRFLGWTGIELMENDALEAWFLMPDQDVEISAAFEYIPVELTIRVEPFNIVGGSLTFELNGESAEIEDVWNDAGTQIIRHVVRAFKQDEMTVTAVPEQNYRLKSISMIGYELNEQALVNTFELTNSSTLEVEFEKNASPVVFEIFDTDTGELLEDTANTFEVTVGGEPVASGDEVVFESQMTLTARPDEAGQWEFTKWRTVNAEGVESDLGNNSTALSTGLLYRGFAKIRAYFKYIGDVELTLPEPGESVSIGGVTWATHNVATPGSFATLVTDYGWYYQFGIRYGWQDGSTKSPEAVWQQPSYWPYTPNVPQPGARLYKEMTWSSTATGSGSNDGNPCPAGYKVPTPADYEALGAATTNEVIYVAGGIKGRLFTDKEDTSKTIFFPAAGFWISTPSGEAPGNVGTHGHYWSDYGVQAPNNPQAGAMQMLNGNDDVMISFATVNYTSRVSALSVRCVKQN